MQKKYIVAYSDGVEIVKVSVLPSVAKRIHDIQRSPNYDKDIMITLDQENACQIRQIRTIRDDNNSEPLQDSVKLLAELEKEALTEKQLREGWHRALCIALAHGMTQENPIIKSFCRQYDVDPSALYPQKCTVCPS